MTPAPIGNQNAAGHGAPKGNANATKHGRRAWESVSRLPKGSGCVRRNLYSLRRDLLEKVEALHGGVSMYHAALVQTVLRHEGRAALSAVWLRKTENLTLAERRQLLAEISEATETRNRVLEKLGLGVSTAGGTAAAWPTARDVSPTNSQAAASDPADANGHRAGGTP